MARVANCAVFMLMLASAMAGTTILHWTNDDAVSASHAEEDAVNLVGRELLAGNGTVVESSFQKKLRVKAEQKVVACKAKCKGNRKKKNQCRKKCTFSKALSDVKKCEKKCKKFAFSNSKATKNLGKTGRTVLYNKCFNGC